MDIKSQTIISALSALRSKKISSVELVESCLKNIQEYNDEYNAFLTIENKEKLLHEAHQIDQTDYSLPLSGIPISIKDMFSTCDLRTTAASKILENYTPRFESTVTKKLKEAGAIIIGKVNQDAWAHGATGENSDFGATRNALNKDLVAGGSSSGSAVSVALGMSMASMGTDTGGSIRVPAAFNGLVGLKPTYGRVSRFGVIAMASSLDTISHITKSVDDSALLLNITSGKDPFDATSIDSVGVKISKSEAKHFTIGIPKEFSVETKNLKKLGAKIVEVSLPNISLAVETYYILVPSEISSNLARYDGIRMGNGREMFGKEARRRIMIGTHALSSGYYDAYYKTAQKVRTLIINDYNKAFEKVDMIYAPVSPVAPPKIGETVNDPLTVYLMDIFTCPVNLAGLPAISMPDGHQFIGPMLSEEKLLNMAKIYENS